MGDQGSGIRDQGSGIRDQGSAGAAAVLRWNALPHHQPPFGNAPVTLCRGLDGPLEIALHAVPPDMNQCTLDRLPDADVRRSVRTAVGTLRGHSEGQAIVCHTRSPERNKGNKERQSGRSLRGRRCPRFDGPAVIAGRTPAQHTARKLLLGHADGLATGRTDEAGARRICWHADRLSVR